MSLRGVLVLVIVAMMATVQLVATFANGPRTADTSVRASTASQSSKLYTVAAADNAGGDNGSNDNSGSSDNGSSDNSDSSDNSSSDNSSSDNSGSDNGSSDNGSSDNSGSDNGSNDNSSDNGSAATADNEAPATSPTEDPDVVIDNVAPTSTTPATTSAAPSSAPASAPSTGTATTSAAPAASPAATSAPVTEASGTSTGIDTTIALPNNHVALQVFSTLQPGITLKIRMVDPLTLPATPGIRVGDLAFRIEATDSSGAQLTSLPAEVNLTVTYADRDVVGLNEAGVTIGRLDPADNTFKPVPKQVNDPATNFAGASISDLGAFAVYVP